MCDDGCIMTTSTTEDTTMTAPYGMTLTDYLKACQTSGVGQCSLSDVMTDTATRLVKLADEVVNGVVALTVARGRLRVIMEEARSTSYSLNKNDGWVYVMLEVKARDVLSFAGRLEVAAMKINLMAGEL